VVVDNSAVLDALVAERPSLEWLRRLLSEDRVHAPHLVDLEFASALRRLLREGKLTQERAAGALTDLAALRIQRYPHEPFLRRIWELTPTLSAYDAAYVVLAETLELPLITADARLARSTGHSARIELV
jgi:predicted nucleic acid-binding protein